MHFDVQPWKHSINRICSDGIGDVPDEAAFGGRSLAGVELVENSIHRLQQVNIVVEAQCRTPCGQSTPKLVGVVGHQ
jgi:hypothetical protein